MRIYVRKQYHSSMYVVTVKIKTEFYFKQEPSVQPGQPAEGDIHLSWTLLGSLGNSSRILK